MRSFSTRFVVVKADIDFSSASNQPSPIFRECSRTMRRCDRGYAFRDENQSIHFTFADNNRTILRCKRGPVINLSGAFRISHFLLTNARILSQLEKRVAAAVVFNWNCDPPLAIELSP